VKLGLIADTHGFLDPGVLPIFSGVHRILHAGDIGPTSILETLAQVAPVTAVRGNNDPTLPIALREVVSVAGKQILLEHIVRPDRLSRPQRLLILETKIELVVFGHTHRACCVEVNGCWFVNPGYAGKVRAWGDPRRTVALLDLGRPLPEALQIKEL
jgi:hypothetical protein